jgi:hypothetical protein
MNQRSLALAFATPPGACRGRCGKLQQGWALRMTRIKNCPVELKELIQWLAAWKVNRELALSAMPYTLYSYLRQENIVDRDWELRDGCRGEHDGYRRRRRVGQ